MMRTSWQWFRRDLKNGELTLLIIALIIAVAATTSLRFFSHGVEKRLQQEAARLMSADLILQSSREIPLSFPEKAKSLSLTTAETLAFSSVLIHNDDFQLAAVNAVSNNYPLRGETRLRDPATQKEISTKKAPEKGTIWIDERLLSLLKVKVGDSLQLGDSHFQITAILIHEPGLGGGLSLFSPRVMIALDDVAATHIVQPGSRLRYQLLLSGNEKSLKRFQKETADNMTASMKLQSLSDTRPEISTPISRSQQYFSLAMIAAVVLAGLAIMTTTRRFAERHYDTLALLRCLGASRKHTLQLLLGEIFWLWLVALIAGAFLGAMIAALLNHLLAGLLPGQSLQLSLLQPLLTGMATATLTLIGFALPALLSLGRVSPLRVLRRELLPPSWSSLAIMACALVSLFALTALETGQTLLTLYVVAGGTLSAFLLWRSLILLMNGLRHRFPSPLFSRLLRDPAISSAQILSLSLGLAAMLLTFTLRGELLGAWQNKIPADAPNQFAINITEPEKLPFIEALESQHIQPEEFFPIVRGRLTAINGKPLSLPSKNGSTPESSKPENNERDEALNRELNLTWRETLHKGTRLSAGEWWQETSLSSSSSSLVSVETKLADRLGIKLGDTLRFSMAEGDIDAKVSNFREVDWDSFQPNFYFIFSPHSLDNFPINYLTSFKVNADQREKLNIITHQFPTVILLDVSTMLKEVHQLLDQIHRALKAILFFVLIAGILVVIAHVSASLDARRFEAALLRATGISRQQLQWRLLSEFIFIGMSAGFIAALINELLAAVIYIKLMDLTPTLHVALWWQAPLAGALLVVIAGWSSARSTWRTSPLLVLRQ